MKRKIKKRKEYAEKQRAKREEKGGSPGAAAHRTVEERKRERERERSIAFATNTSSFFSYTDTPLRRRQDALHGLFLPHLHRVLLLSVSYSIVNCFSSFTSHPVHIRPSFCVVHVQSNICIAYTKSGTRRKNENSSPWP